MQRRPSKPLARTARLGRGLEGDLRVCGGGVQEKRSPREGMQGHCPLFNGLSIIQGLGMALSHGTPKGKVQLFILH